MTGAPFAEHVVASARGRDRSLLEPQRAEWLWARLRTVMEIVLSCVLMPEHLHIVAGVGQWDRLRRVLTGFSRRFGMRFDLLPPEPANSAAIAERMARYGLLNPLRARLVTDPWAWRWSTLRDLGGAAYPVWTELAEVAEVLGAAPRMVLRALTRTADGEPPPLRRERIVAASSEALVCAVGSALRIPDSEVLARALGRRLAVQAAHVIGEPNARRLAAGLGLSERTVFRLRGPRHAGLDAALTCLGDARLHTDVVR